VALPQQVEETLFLLVARQVAPMQQGLEVLLLDLELPPTTQAQAP
jgi:hypothetical protein